MVYNESKKWFLYSQIPKEVNKLFILIEANNQPEYEKALSKLASYLKTRLDTIGKVERIDHDANIYLKQNYSNLPIIIFEGKPVIHETMNIVTVIDNLLPKKEFDSNIQNILKALKNGKDLL